MGNSATRNRKKNIPVVQAKRESISDIETARTGRQDFSTAQTLTEDIPQTEDISEAQPPAEDIIIKCNLEEMTKSFFQDYVIVWHDPQVSSQENQQYIARLKKFCGVLTFTEWQKTRDFVQSSPIACHIVTSGTNGELLVKEVDQLQSVVNIYIFCRNKDYHFQWAKNYSKISCIETDIEKVLSQIQQNLLDWQKQASSFKLNLPAFAPIFNDSDKSTMNNLHRFLKVIPNFQNREQAKNDFVNISKAIYSDPLISEFEQNYNEYDKGQTLRWYTQESFLYKVTNNCLRIATSDSIQYCRLLLQDIQKAIKEQYQTKSKSFNGLLYRGAYLSQEEWASLKANLNREIEMHGFLSVSKEKKIGLNFMKADPSKKVFITIIVPKGLNEEEQGFAEVQEFSQFAAEKEVLFNVRSRFTILETEDDGPYRHLVLLYGAQGFRKYMTEKTPILEISIPTQKNISCSQCKAVPEKVCFFSLTHPQNKIYYCQKCLDDQFSPFLYLPLIKKEPHTIKILGCLLVNSETSELPFYGYKCSSKECQATKQKQYFTCIDCDQKWCQSCFEKDIIHCNQARHNIILETTPFSFWYQKMSTNESRHIKFQSELLSIRSLTFQQAEMFSESLLYEQAIEYYSIYIQRNQAKGRDINLATSYNNLGLVFQQQGEFAKALEYYLKCLEIFKPISGDNHPDIATIHSNIGCVYGNQGEYTKALECYFKSLEVLKSLSEDNHARIFTCYNNIGRVYNCQGEDAKALEYYFKSLDIGKLAYEDSHPEFATVYYNIGGIYDNQGEYAKALEYYFKSLDIAISVYGDQHPKIARVWNDIGLTFFHQAEYKKALEYYLKSLDINKSVYGDNHPEIALYFNNIGHTFLKQGEYKKALEYFFLALDINKSVYQDNHPSIATSLMNIGQAFFQQGEYNMAIESFSKSLNIFKLVYGEKHPGIATSYNNIGQAFFQLGEHKKALEYFFVALDIYKAVYGDSHLDLATCYQSIGTAYDQQGEYEKALEYYFESLEIAKHICGENHPTTGNFYHNIGFSYYNQGEDNKALEYYFKSLEISKSVYGDHHPEIAVYYQHIGLVYDHQKDYKKALEYHLRSLEISELAYGEKHPLVGIAYDYIGLSYLKQKEYKKALGYFLKAFATYKAVYGDSHPDVITASQNVGLIYKYQGEYGKALEYLLPCLEIQKALYGDNHPYTILTQKEIFEILSNLTK